MRDAEAKAKKVVKKAKKRSFIKFCNTINRQTPIKQVWENIGRLSGRTKKYHSQPLITNGETITDPKTKADTIATCYSEMFNCHEYTKDSTSLLIPITMAMIDDSNYDYNKPFTMFELEESLLTLKNTTPGYDEIHNNMLKNMPYNYQSRTLEIINNSFNNSEVLPEWKMATILPILKLDKNPTEPKSFRPISLLSCFAKLIEKLICNRLVYKIETNRKFSETQSGFRKRLCTMDQLSRLENEIRLGLYNRKYTIAIFFDLSHAYDGCLLYTSPSPRDKRQSRMPSSA